MNFKRIFFNHPDVLDPIEKELGENRLKLFAVNLQLGLLVSCGALQAAEQFGEEEIAFIHRMIDRATEGLAIPKKFSTTSRKRRSMCAKVLDELKKTHSSSQLMELLTSKDEGASAEMSELLRAQMEKAFQSFEKKKLRIAEVGGYVTSFLTVLCTGLIIML